GCNIGKSSPVLVGNRVIAVDDRGRMIVCDADTGHEITRKNLGTSMRSTPLVADGKIYACTTEGRWWTLKLVGDKIKEVQKLRLPPHDECYGSPIVSHGRIYLPTSEAMYCIEDTAQKHGVALMALTPAEQVGLPGPHHVQVVPAEVLLATGAKQKFSLNFFDGGGRPIKAPATAAKFTLEGPGEIDEQGNYSAPTGSTHTSTTVRVKVGELKGMARVRIVPPLPWKFDFSGGEVPITWVACRYRHIIRDVDGKKVMVKITTIPKGTRSQGWLGPVDLHDYTVQADVRGAATDGRMPDIGLIAQRYTVDLMGAAQKLQIRTWPPMLEKRMGKTIDFAWQPNLWYTLKVRVSNVGDKAVVQAKVWPHGQAEPAAWTIEADDEAPNRNGSPGLYGNATNAEIFYDNLTVTPNPSTN
ncbi:MAG: PQQ-binding-like beta-propeller repeat protein, partial [Planctomycetia bacterium]|nr:PQQ-binding-like beta-propeller repeat protein [Planctomycetia bacterium]